MSVLGSRWMTSSSVEPPCRRSPCVSDAPRQRPRSSAMIFCTRRSWRPPPNGVVRNSRTMRVAQRRGSPRLRAERQHVGVVVLARVAARSRRRGTARSARRRPCWRPSSSRCRRRRRRCRARSGRSPPRAPPRRRSRGSRPPRVGVGAAVVDRPAQVLARARARRISLSVVAAVIGADRDAALVGDHRAAARARGRERRRRGRGRARRPRAPGGAPRTRELACDRSLGSRQNTVKKRAAGGAARARRGGRR